MTGTSRHTIEAVASMRDAGATAGFDKLGSTAVTSAAKAEAAWTKLGNTVTTAGPRMASAQDLYIERLRSSIALVNARSESERAAVIATQQLADAHRRGGDEGLRLALQLQEAQDRVASEAERAGRRITASTAEVGTMYDRITTRVRQVGPRVAQAFSVGAAGVSAYQASLTNAEGASFQLAASVVGAFGSGGPVAGAIALATAGLGLFLGAQRKNRQEAEAAAKALEQEQAAALAKVAEQAKSSAERVRDLRFELEAARRQGRGERVSAGDLKAEADLLDRQRAAQAALAQAEAEAAVGRGKSVERVRELQGLLASLREERRVRTILEAVEARRAENERLRETEEAIRRAQAAEVTKARDAETTERHRLEGLIDRVRSMRELEGLGEDERRNAQAVLFIRELERSGLKEYANEVRLLTEAERSRAKAAEDRARAESSGKAQEGADFELKQLNARTDRERVLNDLVRKRAELIAQGVREETANLLVATQLAQFDADAVKAEQDKAEDRNDYLQGLREALELAKAETAEQRQQILNERELADAKRKGGEEALRLVKERQAAEAEGAKGGGRGGAGGGGAGSEILGYGARGEIVYADGRVDKGLKRKKDLRKAQRRLAKYQKQGGGDFATFGGALGISGLRQGDDNAIGGAISGRALEAAGVDRFSEFTGPAGYRNGKGGGGGGGGGDSTPAGGRPGDAGGGSGGGGAGAPVVTGQRGPTLPADFDPDVSPEVQRAAEEMQRQVEAAKANKEAATAMESASKDAAEAAKEATSEMEKAREAHQSQVDAIAELAQRVGQFAESSADTASQVARSAADANARLDRAEERLAAAEAILAEGPR